MSQPKRDWEEEFRETYSAMLYHEERDIQDIITFISSLLLSNNKRLSEKIRGKKAITDYPFAWEVCKQTKLEQHHKDCSWKEGMLCDCVGQDSMILGKNLALEQAALIVENE